MASLESVINALYVNSSRYSTVKRFHYGHSNSLCTSIKYIEIPVSGDSFEVPLFALDGFHRMVCAGDNCDTLVAPIYSCGYTSSYKSLEAVMKDALSTPLGNALIKVSVSGSPNPYYVTFGTVFDHELNPQMMLSWIIERTVNAEGNNIYGCKRALLRLDPWICRDKGNTMERFLANKLLSTVLNTYIELPYQFQQTFYQSRRTVDVNTPKVEIDICPFHIKEPEVPSISVTNEKLLQLAAEHVEEILQ